MIVSVESNLSVPAFNLLVLLDNVEKSPFIFGWSALPTNCASVNLPIRILDLSLPRDLKLYVARYYVKATALYMSEIRKIPREEGLMLRKKISTLQDFVFTFSVRYDFHPANNRIWGARYYIASSVVIFFASTSSLSWTDLKCILRRSLLISYLIRDTQKWRVVDPCEY